MCVCVCVNMGERVRCGLSLSLNVTVFRGYHVGTGQEVNGVLFAREHGCLGLASGGCWFWRAPCEPCYARCLKT